MSAELLSNGIPDKTGRSRDKHFKNFLSTRLLGAEFSLFAFISSDSSITSSSITSSLIRFLLFYRNVFHSWYVYYHYAALYLYGELT